MAEGARREGIAFVTIVVTLDHLILTVNDRDASVRFYTEVMGFGHEGEDGPFSVIRVSPETTLQLAPWGTEGGDHLAFALSPEEFDAAFARVRAAERALRRLVPRRGQHAGPGRGGRRAGPRAHACTSSTPTATWSSCATTDPSYDGRRVHLEHRRRAHAAAGAQRPDPDAAAAPAQLVDQRDQDAGARGAHRVPEPDARRR